MQKSSKWAICIEKLTKNFGKKKAVDNISLKVEKGGFWGFLGPNGAGKTTTVNILAGLLPPTAGNVFIEGYSLAKDSLIIKKKIGVVPEKLSLFGRLSLWEHLILIGQLYGLSLTQTESRARDLLDFFDLWQDRGTYVCDSSYGMKKKLALALALIHKPRVLILDEPFEGVDPAVGKKIRELFTILSSRGVTIFITSHIIDIMERYINHVVIIIEGKIAFSSSMQRLKNSKCTLEDLFIELAASNPFNTEQINWLW